MNGDNTAKPTMALNLAAVIAEADQPDVVYQQVVNAVQALLNVDYVALLLRNHDGHWDWCAQAGSWSQQWLETVQSQQGHSLLDYTLAHEGLISTDNLPGETRFSTPQSLLDAGIRSAFSIAFTVAEQNVGVMLGYTHALRQLNNQDRHLCLALVRQASAFIQPLVRLQALEREIAERKRSEEQLRLSAQVFASSPEGIIIIDSHNRLVAVNQAFTQITGYQQDEMIGRKLSSLGSSLMEQDTARELQIALREQEQWRGEIWSRRKSGELYPQWLTVNTIRDAQGQVSHYIAMFVDITEQKLAERRIFHLAYHDALTNLPNRLLLQDRINQALTRAKRQQQEVAVLFVDLDRFKFINDTLGHDIGDLLLKSVAARMINCVRAEDTVARQGGDEFVVLLTNIRHAQDAIIVAQKIIGSLSDSPFLLYHHELHITPSIGISIYPHDGEDVQELLKNADTAMYHAKEGGRATYRFYATDMNATAVERLALENNLRKAIERGEFSMHYQPQIDLMSGRIIGMEALIRWEQFEKGMVSPTKFIPIAEEIGLIAPIGEWVLRSACLQHAHWRAAGYALKMAVNLSARQFRQGNLLEIVSDILQETGMPPAQLKLELTEGMLMQHTDETVNTLHGLHAIGIQLAIDDFGIGYSSLSYLKRFPIHELKIDRSFVRDVYIDADSAAIVSAIIAMAHSLKLRVVAEGVETAAQLACLQQRQCDVIQGYYVSPPLSVEGFTQFLQAFQWLPQEEANKSA